ncbi:unnamed protein product, partial [Nesidiocoris tenuis]
MLGSCYMTTDRFLNCFIGGAVVKNEARIKKTWRLKRECCLLFQGDARPYHSTVKQLIRTVL